jgi:carbonic anhydrase
MLLKVMKALNGYFRLYLINNKIKKRTKMSDFYKKILDNNKQWVEDQLAIDKDYFKDLAKGQTPPLLWIGCSDSRVPANEIIGAKPGEVFVHRNIANMVVHTDMNMLSVLDYAVNVLKVKHVIVCGHYGCGGVKAAMGNDSIGIIDNWIRHIKDVYRLHDKYLNSISDENERFNAFVEINVKEQVFDLAKTSIIQSAWKNGQEVTLHGWVYGLNSGFVSDLGVNFSSDKDLDEVYQLNFPK